MTLTIAESGPLLQLASPAIRSIALAGAAGLALALFRVKTTSLRLFTWSTVLYAALAMPMIGWMLPPLPIPMPALLQQAAMSDAPRAMAQTAVAPAEAPPSPRITNFRSTETTRKGFASVASSAPPRPVAPSSVRAVIRWDAVAATIYLAVALFLLARIAAGFVFSRRLIRAASRIHEARLISRLSSRSNACGLAVAPHALESELTSVPVTMGVLRSSIVLPVDWRDWDDAKLDAVVAHEVSHVARRDALTQSLALLHRAIFWFSPLAWWLERHLADLAEQASDEAALAFGADRNDYARTLLGFFEALHTSPGRVRWQGVSMAKAGQAEQRVERILAWRGAVPMKLKKTIAVAVILLAIPVVYLAASVRPVNPHDSSASVERAQDQTPPPAEPATPVPTPAAASKPSAVVAASPAAMPPAAPSPEADALPTPAPMAGVIAGEVHGGISGGPLPPPALAAPSSPLPPTAYARGRQSYGSGSSHSGYSYAYGYDDDDNQRFVIVSGKTDSLTMSGDSEDIHHVQRLKKTIPGDFIWFERDEKSYIIRDQATIDRARSFWAPQEELGKKQEELGKKQEALGKQQEELGAKMEQVKVNVPDMTAALDKLKAKLQKLGPSATMEQIGDLQSEIGELQSKIGEIQSQAGEQQGKLGDLQGALGEKQGKLGEEQGRLGEQQAKLAHEATIKMKSLLDEAIKNGKAQREPEEGGGASL